MPMYEFYCQACETSFDQMTPMNARDQKVACPKCGSKKTGRKLSVVSVGAGKEAAGGGGGHVHSGGCGCGKPMGSCGMN
jgi:putative FmdB family regulatory protein